MARVAALVVLALVSLAAASCVRRLPDSNRGEAASGGPVRPIQDVLARHTPSLMAIPGVTGTGEGRANDRPVLVVYTSHIAREARTKIPDTIEGYAVEVREIGDVTAPPR
jgi:hypothetical protein